METVHDLLQAKPAGLVAVAADASVMQATVLMNDHAIGAVLVLEGRRLVGIFTERDVLRRVVVESRSPGFTKVRDVMTTDLVCCTPGTPVEEVADLMRRRRIRHLPVLDADDQVLGIISIGDVNANRVTTCEVALHQVQDYVYRRA
jgi:CBS domain-containing protein